MADTSITVTGLHKAFGRNFVLRGVDMTIPAGQVTVLMGANGAGKSTLVKILSGVHAADHGEVRLAGQVFRPANPSAALKAGVVTVHQSINDGVVPDLDIASNLMLDSLADGSGMFINRRALNRRAREIAAAVGLEIDVTRRVSDLTLADRQRVAIARAMAHNPKLLILDEPTSSLSAAEADRLFALIDQFRKQDVAILYISHRMSDIRQLADRIVSMRDGAISGLTEGPRLDYSGAVRAMLGREMTEMELEIPQAGKPVLVARGLQLRHGARRFDLTCHENEVVAVVGLVGSGKSDLAAVLYGLAHPVAGEMSLDGRPYAPRHPGAAIRAGVFMAARDRIINAVVPDFNITRNLTLPFLGHHSRAHFITTATEAATARRMISDMGVVCQSPADPILTLSGGNQQKVMVARWMSEASRLLILDEPFQGVDIQARRDIGAKIRETAIKRATLVLVSELDEAFEVADRVLVLSEGAVVGAHRNENIDMAQLMAEMTDAPGQTAGRLS
ncbi:MAG: sugar ABC transporter ATP-binding protein [Paracoccaceae bacterium]